MDELSDIELYPRSSAFDTHLVTPQSVYYTEEAKEYCTSGRRNREATTAPRQLAFALTS